MRLSSKCDNRNNLPRIIFSVNYNPLNANFTKWSNTLKHFVGNLPTNCLSVFDHFVGLVLKGINLHPPQTNEETKIPDKNSTYILRLKQFCHCEEGFRCFGCSKVDALCIKMILLIYLNLLPNFHKKGGGGA